MAVSYGYGPTSEDWDESSVISKPKIKQRTFKKDHDNIKDKFLSNVLQFQSSDNQRGRSIEDNTISEDPNLISIPARPTMSENRYSPDVTIRPSSRHHRIRSLSPPSETSGHQPKIDVRARSVHNPGTSRSHPAPFWIKTSSNRKSVPYNTDSDLFDNVMNDNKYKNLSWPRPSQNIPPLDDHPPPLSRPDTPSIASGARIPGSRIEEYNMNDGHNVSFRSAFSNIFKINRNNGSKRPQTHISHHRKFSDNHSGRVSTVSTHNYGANTTPQLSFTSVADIVVDIMRKVPQLSLLVECVDALSLSRFSFFKIPFIIIVILLMMFAFSYILLLLEGLLKLMKIIFSPAIFLTNLIFGSYSKSS